ncbi:unnamed protein product [Dracunculus medinensis]|uniref:ACB domain-containing protein n=1 Tax=Dracunculus medinensis TaxID=318479 RepID=A0A0N4UBW6_DRAME|nr:unnamed protein product [Dracunculus medinensis]
MSIDERFQAAVNIVQKLPKEGPLKTTNDQKLLFYSLYKQACNGRINSPQPSIFNFVERAKWNSWNELGDMAQNDAKIKYIEALQNIFDEAAGTINILEWLTNTINDPNLSKNFELIGRSVK